MAQRGPRFGRIFRRKWKKADGSVGELPTFWIEFYQNGKQRRESSHSEKRSDAEALLKRRHGEMSLGTLASTAVGKVTTARLLDLLLADYEMNGKSLSWAKYIDGHLRPVFGEIRASMVGAEVIGRYVTERHRAGVANSTINRELSLLRRAFNLGFHAEPRLVATVPRIPRFAEHNVRKGFFSDEDFVLLRAELPEHLRPVITFAYSTGCRKGEILGLRWTQVDFQAKVVRLEPGETKNRESRIVPMIGEVREMLGIQKQIRDQSYPICPFIFSRYGKQIRNFYSAWEEASKRAGLVDTGGKPRKLFHDLRRTGIRNLVRAGVPERVAMAISGHKTRSVFDRYNIVNEQDVLKAGESLETFFTAQKKDKSRTSAENPLSDAPSPTDAKTSSKLLN
jgi:integrase